MNLGDFLESKRWKVTQNYIYSIGASVVLMGALFKLMHWPGAGPMLTMGMSVEALIFFISAFEPMLETPDWKKVYPQLRTGDEEKKMIAEYERLDKEFGKGGAVGGGGGSRGTVSNGNAVAHEGGSAINNLPEAQLKSLNESLQQLSDTAKGLKKISDATVATDSFVKNLGEASQSIGKVVEANNKVSTELTQSVSSLTGSYKTSAEAISTSGKKITTEMEQSAQNFTSQLNSSIDSLKTSYKEMSESVSGGFKSLDKNSSKYIGNIEKLNKNLAAVNAMYEIQLQGAGKIESMVGEYTKGVGEVNKLIQKSIEETRKFNDNTKEISENIQALNKVYGNMLGALNVKK